MGCNEFSGMDFRLLGADLGNSLKQPPLPILNRIWWLNSACFPLQTDKTR